MIKVVREEEVSAKDGVLVVDPNSTTSVEISVGGDRLIIQFIRNTPAGAEVELVEAVSKTEVYRVKDPDLKLKKSPSRKLLNEDITERVRALGMTVQDFVKEAGTFSTASFYGLRLGTISPEMRKRILAAIAKKEKAARK